MTNVESNNLPQHIIDALIDAGFEVKPKHVLGDSNIKNGNFSGASTERHRRYPVQMSEIYHHKGWH